MNENEDFFTTYDLNISAVLVALGHKLDHIERKQNNRALFFFKFSPAIKKVVQNYWKQEIKINPQKLFDSVKFLKNRLYSNL